MCTAAKRGDEQNRSRERPVPKRKKNPEEQPASSTAKATIERFPQQRLPPRYQERGVKNHIKEYGTREEKESILGDLEHNYWKSDKNSQKEVAKSQG